MKKKPVALEFSALQIEGNLIAPAMLAAIDRREAGSQAEADYGVKKGLTIRDEIARYFRIGQASFLDFASVSNPSTQVTIRFVEALLRDVFGFEDIVRVGSRTEDSRLYALTLEAVAGRVPVVVVPSHDNLDRASDSLPSEGRRRSAATALQDWLNHSDAALWGFASNGETLRLMRDNESLTRPAYIEANLRRIFEAEDFASFAALWLLVHSSRFGQAGSAATDCSLERWREQGAKQGVAARDRLRDGVETALVALGTGFLSDNAELRERVATGALPLQSYFSELLRLVYRLIFLMAAEDRDLLHTPSASLAARRLYAQGYSLAALRERSIRRSAWDNHYDRWEGLRIVFAALDRGEKLLGLPALGSLFGRGEVPDLDEAKLSNKSLLEAVYRLSWLVDDSTLQPVNWRDMETEELGSVYESLLELTPRLSADGRAFSFAEGAETKGNQRKTTGSYYTPDSLVQALLDSALDPVLDRIEAESDDPGEALANVTVIDPACGSGHFLLAAARRIATRVARHRAGGVASAADYRHALRDVVRQCIHGVDRNPMAVELTRVALWIETVEPGKPLGFLDANIRCGDALLGVFDLDALRKGIPDAAYKPLTGDDKETAKHFAKRNKAEREGQGALDFAVGGGRLPAPPPLGRLTADVKALPEETVDDVAQKAKRWAAAERDPRRWSWRIAADIYMAAFLTPKAGGVPENRIQVAIPTTGHVWQALSGKQVYGPLVGHAQHTAGAACAFHWPLEFPDIMEHGGFDCVLGNPPWEVLQLSETEHFAQRFPEVSELAGAARKAAIADLKQTNPVAFAAYEFSKRAVDAGNEFARGSGRFDLTARGKINTYALFADLAAALPKPNGYAGLILPLGIATNDSTAAFFAHLMSKNRLVSLLSMAEIKQWFAGTKDNQSFCLMTIGASSTANFAFRLEEPSHLADPERHFTLSISEISRINPNTKTAPVFRTRSDAQLTAKIYAHAPVLIDETKEPAANPWGLEFRQGLVNMTSDSHLFRPAAELRASGLMRTGLNWVHKSHHLPQDLGESASKKYPLAKGHLGRYLPLFESKMFSFFDSRFGYYPDGSIDDTRALPRPTFEQQCDPDWVASPRFWVEETLVDQQIRAADWNCPWLFVFRKLTNTTNERTLISSVVPMSAVGDSAYVIFSNKDTMLFSALIANFSSIVIDFVARQKVGGTNLNLFYLYQFPILPPSAYSESDMALIVPCVLELTYTSQSMKPFARDLGYDGPPFVWDEERRAWLRAELDAFYARAYGLTRDELRYILDPADVKGPDYPSETFRVLKNNEIKKYGEYRTRRLVLDAWDRMERGEIADVSAPIRVTAPTIAPLDTEAVPDGAWATPVGGNVRDKTLAQIAAVLKALAGPTPIDLAQRATIYALEPRLLTPWLDDTRRTEWLRLIGPEAEPRPGVTTFGLGGATGWGEAVRVLTATGCLIEDSSAQTWAPGQGLDAYFTDSWPRRAVFALEAATAILGADSAVTPSAEEEAGLKALAA